MIVADTNLIFYLFVRGQETPQAEKAYLIDPHWIAPSLWESEFRSALVLYLWKGLLDLDEALRHAANAERLMAGRSRSVNSSQVLVLARNSGCSAYDCEFVALAQELGVPLVTSDRRLAAKFKSIAVPLRQFVK